MVKIGVIGVGKWGKNHLRVLNEIDCELIGISDADLSKKELSEKSNIKFFPDYHNLLKEVDCVTIAAPTDLHFKIVKDSLESGKHVLVEKPIADTSEKAKQLVELADKNDLILSVGYIYRFNNSIIRLKEIMNKIGKIQYITCRYIHSTKPPRTDSGAIINLSIHPIDILNFITNSKPVKVFAKKSNILSKTLEDSAIITLDYNDFFATIEVSCTHPEKKRDMWIIAENEKLYVDYFCQKIIRYPIKVSYEKVERQDSFEEKINANEPLKDELKYFIEVVKTNKKKKISNIQNIGREEYYTTRICELSVESAETGQEKKIP
jgi:UDP-N-acetylglucosamine 3-dehydrogenase